MLCQKSWICPAGQAKALNQDGIHRWPEMAEEELEMVWAWLHDQNLLDDPNGKELPLEWALCRFWALSKHQFGDTFDEAMRSAPFCTVCCPEKISLWLHPNGHWVGLGPKVPLLSGPHQYSAHLGKATPPVPQGGNLAGCPSGRAGGQGSDWSHLDQGSSCGVLCHCS